MRQQYVTLAFYRAPGRLMDKVIRWFQRHIQRHDAQASSYSHVEIFLPDGRFFSSSPRNPSGARFAYLEVDTGKWDYVRIPIPADLVDDLYAACRAIEGDSYDWLGVLRFGIPILRQCSYKWFCSEAVLHVLQDIGLMEGPRPHRTSPADLYVQAREAYGDVG